MNAAVEQTPSLPAGGGQLVRTAERVVGVSLLAVCVVAGGTFVALHALGGKPEVAALRPLDSMPPAQLREAEQLALREMREQVDVQLSRFELARQQRAQNQTMQEQAQALAAAREAEMRARAAAKASAEAAAAAERRAREAAQRVIAQATPKPVAAAPKPKQEELASLLRPEPRVTAKPRSGTQSNGLVPASVDWRSCDAPTYPAASERLGEEGDVILEFEIDERGRVVKGRVGESSGYSRLDRAALKAIRRCRFAPATENGRPSASVTRVRFSWKIS